MKHWSKAFTEGKIPIFLFRTVHKGYFEAEEQRTVISETVKKINMYKLILLAKSEDKAFKVLKLP